MLILPSNICLIFERIELKQKKQNHKNLFQLSPFRDVMFGGNGYRRFTRRLPFLINTVQYYHNKHRTENISGYISANNKRLQKSSITLKNFKAHRYKFKFKMK